MKTNIITLTFQINFLFILFISPFSEVFSQNWLPAGSGTNNGANGGIALQEFNGKLIAGGAFSQAGSVNAYGVAMWDGLDWSIVDSSMNSNFAVRPFVVFQGYLYGFVTNPTGIMSGYMIKLDSNFTCQIVPNSNYYNSNLPGTVYRAAVYNNELYVGGRFDHIGNIPANHIAKWDGTNWLPVGSGINDQYIFEFKEYNNELYVGGSFTDAGGVSVNNLAKWNGSNWSDVGGGLTGPGAWDFSDMEVYNNELYIGGGFLSAGGQFMEYLTKWNGNIFSDVGGGLGFSGPPDVMKVYGNKLYFGGYFNTGIWGNETGTWDGLNFASLGTGLNAGPTNFEIYNCQLYAGGRFDATGYAQGVAFLDTTDCTTSIESIYLPEYSISIYPNPGNGNFTFEFNDVCSGIFVVTNLLGEIIKTGTFANTRMLQCEINGSAGVYFVNVNTGKSVLNSKLVKN